MKKSFSTIAFLLTLSIASSFAEVITVFQKIKTIEEVEDDVRYIFVSIDENGKGYMLTEESTGSNKFVGKDIGVLSNQIEESSDLVFWKIKKSSDGFNIVSAQDGGYISNKKATTNLTKSKTPYSWNLLAKDSLFCFSCSDNAKRRIALNYGWELNPFGAYTETLGYLDITLYKETDIEIPPSDSIENENGLKELKGGWTKESLANVDFQNITELDLTGIDVFPLSTLPFKNMEEQSNAIIYIKGSQKSKINDNWKNVVLCTDEGNKLLRPMVLHDKQPFNISRSFHVGKDSLVYTRSFTDNQWQTLFLPFAPYESDKDIIIKGIDKIGSDSLVLSTKESVNAQEPLLIRYNGDNVDFTFTFKSKEQSLEPDNGESTNQSFIGTFHVKETTESDNGIFMLDSEGKKFVLTTTGSWLSPFRCYLLLENNSYKSFMIDEDELLSIEEIKKGNPENIIYNIYGRKISTGKTWRDAASSLPSGIYIENNIKRKK